MYNFVEEKEEKPTIFKFLVLVIKKKLSTSVDLIVDNIEGNFKKICFIVDSFRGLAYNLHSCQMIYYIYFWH